MKLAVTTVVALALAGSALAAPQSATLTIRHQLHGCHTWSFDGSTWKATQAIRLPRGSRLTVINNDMMSHTLVQVSGPKASISGSVMMHMGAAAAVVFRTKGRYVLGTHPGLDYFKGVQTLGEDNVLRVVVTVS